MNVERQEILHTIDRAIMTHEANIARLELKQATLGDDAPSSIGRSIEHAQEEIERLKAKKSRIGGNGGRVTQRERESSITAQLGMIQGDLLALRADVTTQGNGLDEMRSLTGEIRVLADAIREECPLFRADMEEGPLIYVKHLPKSGC